MKEKITELLKSENATLKINKFCTLHRWKKDALGSRADGIEVVFMIASGFISVSPIDSRNWRGVVDEVAEAQTLAFALAAEEYNRQLKNGCIG